MRGVLALHRGGTGRYVATDEGFCVSRRTCPPFREMRSDTRNRGVPAPRTARGGRRRDPAGRRPLAVAFVLVVVVAASSALSWAVVPRLVSPRVDGPAFSPPQDRAWTGPGACSITPEYDRTMQKVLVSLDRKDTTLGLLDGLLEHLPSYAEIIVLLSRASLEGIHAELKDKPYRDRIRLVAHDVECPTDKRIYLLFRDEDKLVPLTSRVGRVPSAASGLRISSKWA